MGNCQQGGSQNDTDSKGVSELLSKNVWTRSKEEWRRTGFKHFEYDILEVVHVGAAVVLELLSRSLPLNLPQRLHTHSMVGQQLDFTCISPSYETQCVTICCTLCLQIKQRTLDL